MGEEKKEVLGEDLQMQSVMLEEQTDEKDQSEQEDKKVQEAKKREEEQKRKEQEKLKKDKEWFLKLGLPSILYAIIYTFCMYRNESGITMPIWIGATVGYSCYVLKRLERKLKRDSISAIVIMLLLGIATVFTDNPNIILLNYLGFFLALLTFLLHNVHEDKDWGMATYFLQMAVAVLGAISCVGAPIVESLAFLKDHKKNKNTRMDSVIIGLIIAIPCVLFLTVLLGSADAVFGEIIENFFETMVIPERLVEICFMLGFGFFASYCGMRYLAKKSGTGQIFTVKKYEPAIAFTVTVMITLLYFFFCVVQIKYLFLGQGTLPSGMTYAEYARTGFFQLLFVAVFNFFFVLGVTFFFEKKSSLDWILRIFCGCTFLMIVSSAYRMLLYISAYQLTFLRVFVLLTLFVITLLMIGVLLLLGKKQFSIFRYSFVVVSVCYVLFAFSGVDARIASYNLEHMTEDTKQDTLDYIGTLSADAAPVIEEYLADQPELKNKIDRILVTTNLDGWYSEADRDISWYLCYRSFTEPKVKNISVRTFNVSRFLAAKAMGL